MWKSLIRCGVVGGIVVYLWLTLAWVVFPAHRILINKFTEKTEVTQTITKYAPHDGIYVLTPCDTKEEKAKESYMIFLNIRRGDCNSMVRPMIQGLLMQIIGAAFITYLLLKSKALKYWGRVWFVTIIGLIVAILGVLPDWNWWQFPSSWVALEVVDLVVGWFLGGLVIAKLIKN
ncbi:MAG: hypothetical protein JSS30_03195 [Verrucomicrobia bacterium]|nr:hypothetical protein [Verrucomicrobiota bacterium]